MDSSVSYSAEYKNSSHVAHCDWSALFDYHIEALFETFSCCCESTCPMYSKMDQQTILCIVNLKYEILVLFQVAHYTEQAVACSG